MNIVNLNYVERSIIIASNAASDIVEAKKKYDKEWKVVDLNDLDTAPDDIRHQWKSVSLEIMCMMEISYQHMDYVMELVEKLISNTYNLIEQANKYAEQINHGTISSISHEMACIFDDAKLQLAYRTVIDILKLREKSIEIIGGKLNEP